MDKFMPDKPTTNAKLMHVCLLVGDLCCAKSFFRTKIAFVGENSRVL